MRWTDSNFFKYKRRNTITVNIGSVPLGSSFPIRIQSMTNTLTANIDETAAQCRRIIEAGADYVRLTVPSLSDVKAFASVKEVLRNEGYHTPLIADVHFNPDIAIALTGYADKIRINPGNFQDVDKFFTLIQKCKKNGVAIRIGVNHGSLSEEILNQFGDTPAGMAESAMQYLRICKENNFDQVVLSMKASNVRVMVYAVRLVTRLMLEDDMNFPLHLGVTEAGEGEDGRIKSAAGIGTLLADGMGDTIRVSLTEDPEMEIPVAGKLIQFTGGLATKNRIPVKKGYEKYYIQYRRHLTRKTGNIGGHLAPVVIGYDDLGEVDMVEAVFTDISDQLISLLSSNKKAVLVYQAATENVQAELRWLRLTLEDAGCDVPVIFRLHLSEKTPENFMLMAAALLGGTFMDGFGDGIWLTCQTLYDNSFIHSVSLSILQACRSRISKTEYIACPSCGRTHFNLMDTLAKIKQATAHLKGLKIGVMGCIVNGPGEMADADYGYVGTGKGKITLYKARQVVKKAIPEENAVSELIRLIKENGDWKEP